MRPTLALSAVALLLALVVAVGHAPAPARAQDLPPRPPAPTTVPPTPTPAPQEEELPAPERLKPGRLTGTVIDVATGAPAVNVAVRIGGRIVVSDRNGNYDWSGIPAGGYELALALPSDWGIATQGTLMVEVRPEETTVQHLFFRSS